MKYYFPTNPVLQITQAWGNVNFASYPPPTGRHMGVDIGGLVGNVIYAAAAGVVETASPVNLHGYGRHIIIQHDGYKTLYAHLHEMFVTVGETVPSGFQIGEMGGQPGDNDPIDGASTGSHLHFEVILLSKPSGDYVQTWAGYTVDPLPYLTQLAYGDPKFTATVLASKGVRVRADSNVNSVQIGSWGTQTTHPIIGVVDKGADQWAQAWSLRPEYAAVKYGGEKLMDVSLPVLPPPTLDVNAIRRDEIDRMIVYLQNRKSELV